MVDTLRFLGKAPPDAMVDVLNETFGMMADYGTVDFSAPSPLFGTKTSVTATMLQPPFGGGQYSGTLVLVYNRVDVSQFFSGSDLIRSIPLPGTTNDIINVLKAKYNLYIDPSDFVIEHIPANTITYDLKTMPGSLRWTGSVLMSVVGAPIPLSQIFVNTTVNGIVVPSLTFPFIVPTTYLSGIPAPKLTYNLPALVALNSSLLWGFWYNQNGTYTDTGLYQYPAPIALAMLIGRYLRINIAPQDFINSAPQSVTGGQANTSITITGQPALGYSGQVTLLYNRYDASVFFGTTPVPISASAISQDTLLGAINAKYNTNLLGSDFSVVASSNGTQYTLTALNSSVAWIGSFVVQVTQP